jgi:1-aminocyclopropane-1-carboxylate deaminase
MSNFIPYQAPKIQPWITEESERTHVKVLIRREDQNHSFVSGNKWWKLKYNLLRAIEEKYETIITFGGAYSNHIYATAAACKELSLKSVGIIRGEETLQLNSTLAFAKDCGMTLEYISRDAYRKKSEPEFLKSLQEKFGQCFIVPEGGTNELAIRGSEELGHEILKTDFDYCCLPVGTGGTIVGIINAFDGQRKIIGIPVLKDGGFLNGEIKKYLKADFKNWQLLLDYHFGGYAKTTPELNSFVEHTTVSGIPTEFVYSAKLFWAVRDLLSKKFFERGSTVLLVHTGGLRAVM